MDDDKRRELEALVVEIERDRAKYTEITHDWLLEMLNTSVENGLDYTIPWYFYVRDIRQLLVLAMRGLERDKLGAENAGLRAGIAVLHRELAALEADVELHADCDRMMLEAQCDIERESARLRSKLWQCFLRDKETK